MKAKPNLKLEYRSFVFVGVGVLIVGVAVPVAPVVAGGRGGFLSHDDDVATS